MGPAAATTPSTRAPAPIHVRRHFGVLESGAHGGDDRLTGAGNLIGDARHLDGSTGGNDVLDATRAEEGSDWMATPESLFH